MVTVKNYFQLHKLMFSFVKPQSTRFKRNQRSQFNNKTFPKIFFGMDVLGMSLPYLKSIFNRLSEVLFSLGMTWIHSFSVMLV